MQASQSLLDYAAAAREAALRAAEVLNHWRAKFQVREKARFDLVTDADLESQKTIHDFLLNRFSGHEFLGEETAPSPLALSPRGRGESARPSPDSPPTWIVDPIDGTTNYVHDCPFYCISIGLQIAGELVVGAVYDPSRKEMFWGIKGLGAWLGERRLRTSSTDRLEDSLLATGFPPDLRGHEQTLDWWRVFSFKARSLRRTGSTALNMVYVASGRFDGYWAFDNHVWDVAGATVILREAGGHISNVDGSAYDPYTADALASNGPLHAALQDIFRHGLSN